MLKLQIPVNSKGDIFEFKLAKEKVTIGRRHDNDIRIKETYVSAYHAELSRGEDGQIYLRDRDSSNGTYLNGTRIRDKVEIVSGDILKFGSLHCNIIEVVDKNSLPPLPERSLKRKTYGLSSDATTAPVAIQNRTASVSAKNNVDISRGSSTSVPLHVNGIAYTASSPGPNISTQTQPFRSENVNHDNDSFLARELEALKKQLELNRNELKRAKEDLQAKSVELTNTKANSAEEEERKGEAIKALEKKLKTRESSSDTLDHRLRLANQRVEQLESELEHHKTDMSAEIKAAMQRLTHTKNDNVLLQGTLDALESERNKHRDESLKLSRKLGKTREGFSFFLRNSGAKLEESDKVRADLEFNHNESMTRLRGLEAELDSLRGDFSKMEANYRLRLTKTEKDLRRTLKSEQTQGKDLEVAQEKLISQRAEIVKLESSLESVIAEKDAAEEDWRYRILDLKTTNQKLVGYTADLNLLEAQVKKTTSEIKKLKNEKYVLQKETKELKMESGSLSVEAEKVLKEKERSTAIIEQVREESKKASHKLDSILQNLHESEKKVTYLRSLEYELEKSVLRTQRSALSRKGIYREDEESYTTIWPETEQLICRELIDRLELLEDLLKRYQHSWFFPKVAEQLNLLRDSFMVLLKNHSVDQFDLEPGTELSVESRKKIQLISVDDLGDSKLKRLSNQRCDDGKRTTVLQTLRPGYIYSKGGHDVIIRKAEVIVA